MIRELTLSEVEDVSGGDAMNTPISWVSTVGGVASGMFSGGVRGAIGGGLAGFAVGALMGAIYSMAS